MWVSPKELGRALWYTLSSSTLELCCLALESSKAGPNVWPTVTLRRFPITPGLTTSCSLKM